MRWKKKPRWLKLGLKVLIASWVILFILFLLSNILMAGLGGKFEPFLMVIFSFIASLIIASITALISYSKDKRK